MSPWDKKLYNFQVLLDQQVTNHNSGVDVVRANLMKLAKDASAVQSRMLLEFALCNPELAQVPESKKEREFDTVFDMISKNVLSSLVAFGNDYLDNYEDEAD